MTDRLVRLYQLLPAIYRIRDADQGEPLRALLQVIAEQVNLIEDDIDQLYENWFIETAEDWVVPYIGDLIGYHPVHEAGEPVAPRDPRSQALNKILIPRRDVANTIRYRRKKGSLALLELLANDVAGWPARAVEFYRLLGWTQALNHLRLAQGCMVDLRNGEKLEDLDGPFDRLAHTVEVRRINAADDFRSQPIIVEDPASLAERYNLPGQGRYNLPSVGLFIWRLRACPVTGGYADHTTGTKAFRIDRKPTCYTFSILGNDIPLYTWPVPEPSPSWLAGELNVPAPIRRRSLAAHLDDYYGPGKSFCLYERETPTAKQRAAAKGQKLEPVITPVLANRLVVANLSDWHYRPKPGQVVVDPELGRIVFPSRENPEDLLVSYHYGFSADMGGGEYRRSPVDPPGLNAQESPKYYQVKQDPDPLATPLSDAIAQWKIDHPPHAVIEVADSGAYPDSIDIVFDPETPGQTLILRSAERCRPTFRLLNKQANKSDDLNIAGGPGNRFTLDGVLVTGRGVRIVGDLDQVTIRHSTLTPGWELDSECIPCCGNEPSLSLVDSPPVEDTESSGEYVGDGAEQPGEEQQHESSEQLQPSQQGKPNGKPPQEDKLPPPDLGCRDEPPPQHTTSVLVESSILGSISVERDAVGKEPLQIIILDSILDATELELDALSSAFPVNGYAHAVLTIQRSTVFGVIATHAVELGENTIFYSPLYAARTQRGCLRFSYVTPGSRTPRRYNCQPDLIAALLQPENGPKPSNEKVDYLVRPVFNETRYGRPTYTQLAFDCPYEIRRGADDESEIGAFHDLYQPQREANLRARLKEYTPANVDAGILFAS